MQKAIAAILNFTMVRKRSKTFGAVELNQFTKHFKTQYNER